MLFLSVLGVYDYGGFLAALRLAAAPILPSLGTYQVGIPNWLLEALYPPR
jgi:hypothetical protein